MSDTISTPRQNFTLKNTQTEIEEKLRYITDKLPIYKFIEKNDALNSIRIEATRSFQSQHLDFRFQESNETSTTFEVEVSKSTGGMTNDDSSLYAKKNMDDVMSYLTKCLDGYVITEEDAKKLQSEQNNNMILYAVGFVILMIFIFWI
jgi:hypothetical protein|tara:strand:+ start:330 stop:773 length:444 start_codon:yes stop_codon:yes gene_type:complete